MKRLALLLLVGCSTTKQPTEPVRWEDPELQVLCWRVPEGISCLPADQIKAKERWK